MEAYAVILMDSKMYKLRKYNIAKLKIISVMCGSVESIKICVVYYFRSLLGFGIRYSLVPHN